MEYIRNQFGILDCTRRAHMVEMGLSLSRAEIAGNETIRGAVVGIVTPPY